MIPSQETVDSIKSMQSQEVRGYTCIDYLCEYEHEIPAVDAECRSQMVQWCYQIVDYCKFSRETAALAISTFDRYLCTASGKEALHDTAKFQLAAMTALYLIVKVHEPEIMGVELVAKLSRGVYTVDEIEKMEKQMLASLAWRINAPTALSFVRKLLELFPKHAVSAEVLHAAYDLSKYQTELALSDYNFVTIPASILAYTSLVNAFDCLTIDVEIYDRFCSIMAETLNIDGIEQITVPIQNSLYEAISNSTERQQLAFRSEPMDKPRRVSAGSRSAAEVSPCAVCA